MEVSVSPVHCLVKVFLVSCCEIEQVAQHFLGKIRKVEQSRKIGNLVEKFS